jgi:1,2-diacylglycerol 3-alpha-glucosyltransferase
MNIVMLCDFFNEALEYQENLLVKYYAKHGHRVSVIASTFDSVFDYYADRHDADAPARTYEAGGARIYKLRYRYNVLNRLRAYTDISGILQTERPDLIFVHDIMLNLPEAVRYARRNPNCRMILDYHADYSNSGKNWLSLKVLHGTIRKWFLDRARPHLSRIFPIVPAGAVFLHEIYGVPHDEMEVLPLGADTDLGTAVRSQRRGAGLRRSLGIPADDPVIFTGGKLAPAKKTELLIEAVQRLANPRLHLVVVGEAGADDAQYGQTLRERAARVPNVQMLGWLGREDIYACLDMSDLAVFPASQSILWQQAISMGLPLVAGDTGHQDISYLNRYDNIVVLRGQDISVEGLASAIGRIVGDTRVAETMRQGALRVSDECLNWNALIARTLRFNAAHERSPS